MVSGTIPEITQWLQEANDKLTEAAEIEVATPYQFTTTQGTEQYAPPADFGRARRLEVQPQGSMMWTPLMELDVDMHAPPFLGVSLNTGRPSGYFYWGGNLWLIPSPDSVYTIKLWYYQRANQLVQGTDVPIIDQRFHYLLRAYAVARAKQKIDDPGYSTYDQIFDAGKFGMVSSLEEERHAEGPLVVREI